MARILIISCTSYGPDSRVKRHAEALVGRGDEVDVLCLENPRSVPLNGVNVIGLSRPRHRSDGISSFCYMQFFISSVSRAVRLSLGRRYDVAIVCAMRTAAILCTALLRLLGSRVILDLGDDTAEVHQKDLVGRHGASRAWLPMVEQAIRAKFVDRVIVAHAIYRQLLVQVGIPERKIRVVLDVPDPNIFKWRQRDHDAPRLPFTIVSYGATTSRLDGSVPLPIVLNSGSIASLLRIDVAIHAISLLWHRVPDIRLCVIGGSDDYVFRARAVTEFLNLRTHVTFHNQPSLEALPGILENASLGLVSNDSISAAGMSLPPQLMRYAALGIPSVAPRLRSIEAYFGEDAVRLYESGNARALAGAIVNLYEHPDVRREMARHAVSIAESLGWEHQRRQLLEAIDSLLEEESGAQAASDSSSGPGWWSLDGWLRQGRQIAWLRSNRWRGRETPTHNSQRCRYHSRATHSARNRGCYPQRECPGVSRVQWMLTRAGTAGHHGQIAPCHS